jgi:hypothetical protein
MATTQNAFNWLDFTSPVKEVARAQLNCHTPRNQNTAFAFHSEPALSG